MLLESVRFGMIEVPENKIIRMKKPILGFERLDKFCLVEQEEFRPFCWLQAVDDPSVAFIVVNPVLFYPGYKIEVHSNEVAELEITSPEAIETYVIVTVPADPRSMSVNLQGPILVNTANNLAKQLVLVNSDYGIQHPLIDVADTAEVDDRTPEPVGV